MPLKRPYRHDRPSDPAILDGMNEKPGKTFQFGLRDLLWVVLVVALAVGWWIDRRAILNSAEAEATAARERFAAYAELEAEKEREFNRLWGSRLQRILKGD